MQENNEVKVTAIGVFESCPDEKLSQDYYESLNKFILSEAHLQENISTVKIHQMSSKQQGKLFVHLVKVELTSIQLHQEALGKKWLAQGKQDKTNAWKHPVISRLCLPLSYLVEIWTYKHTV